MFDMGLAGETPNEELQSQMMWFYDALDVAQYSGNTVEVETELREFLRQFERQDRI